MTQRRDLFTKNLRDVNYHTQDGQTISMGELTHEEVKTVMEILMAKRKNIHVKAMKAKDLLRSIRSCDINSAFYRIAFDIIRANRKW